MKLKWILLVYLLVFSHFIFSQNNDIVIVGEPNHKFLKERDDSFFFEGISKIGMTYTPVKNFID